MSGFQLDGTEQQQERFKIWWSPRSHLGSNLPFSFVAHLFVLVSAPILPCDAMTLRSCEQSTFINVKFLSLVSLSLCDFLISKRYANWSVYSGLPLSAATQLNGWTVENGSVNPCGVVWRYCICQHKSLGSQHLKLLLQLIFQIKCLILAYRPFNRSVCNLSKFGDAEMGWPMEKKEEEGKLHQHLSFFKLRGQLLNSCV